MQRHFPLFYTKPKVMKLFVHHFFYLVLVSALLQACTKDKPAETTDPAPTPVDSGVYDPNSLFPLKYGASWEYLHDNGQIETVTCGPLVHDTSTSMYGTKNPYVGHYLKNSLPFSTSLKTEPKLYGKLVANSNVVLRAYAVDCSKGGLMPAVIADRSLGNMRFRPGHGGCSSGSPPISYYSICIDTSVSEAGYKDVFLSMNAPIEGVSVVEVEEGDWDADQFQVKQPFVFKGPKQFSMSWWVRGVGLIRRDTYENNQLIDRMRLVNYSIPH